MILLFARIDLQERQPKTVVALACYSGLTPNCPPRRSLLAIVSPATGISIPTGEQGQNRMRKSDEYMAEGRDAGTWRLDTPRGASYIDLIVRDISIDVAFEEDATSRLNAFWKVRKHLEWR